MITVAIWLYDERPIPTYYNRNNYNYTVILHTMNPVGMENMQALIDMYWR